MTKPVELGQIASTGVSEAFKNRLINGNFGIWQRGTSTSSAAYLADRWQIENAGTHSQSSDVPSGQGFPYSCTIFGNPKSIGPWCHNFIHHNPLVPAFTQ